MKKNEKIAEQKDNGIAESGYAAIGGQSLLTEMQEELTGITLVPDRIKIPAGGGTAFELQGEGDETEIVKEIVGVILYHHPAYALYHDRYNGGNNPPDCGSYDGEMGIGDPGGECATCPYNQFGSGEGAGKRCKNKRMLYVLQEGELFPVVFSLPVGSLRPFIRYLKIQLTKGRRLSQVVTRIRLKKVTNSGGVAYSQAVFTYDRLLSPAERKAIEPILAQAKGYAGNLSIDVMRDDDEKVCVDAETGEIIVPLT